MRQSENCVQESAPCIDSCIRNECKHMFCLTPLEKGLFYNSLTLVSFCPEVNRESRSSKGIVPKCYFDAKPHFPLFMLETDRETSVKREKEYLVAHENRIQNQLLSQKQIFVPHPGKSKTTCFVCRTSYVDYRKHIQTRKHKKKIHSSKMQGPINQLIEIVSQQYISSLKEDAYNISTTEQSRMAFSKTEEDIQKNYLRSPKKMSKETKSKCYSRIEKASSDPLALEQLAEIQLKAYASVNKGEQYRTSTINLIPLHEEFRVSDYLA